jgi:isopenicillin N synthase-like dioxygenase
MQVINAGDCMEFLSGGYYKATIHRVVQPPADQRGYTRLGAFYFAMPDDDIKLIPASGSPVLQRGGIRRRFEDADAPTAEIWRKERTAAYGRTNLKQGKETGVEEEHISGVLVKHYS